MTWNSYNLDKIAHDLVLEARKADPDSLNQSHKMRMAVAYGLERFWGEHLRLQTKEKDQAKSQYWKKTWDALCDVMLKTGIELPKDPVNANKTSEIETISAKIWALKTEDQGFCLAVLTQLCDSIVWWTQRYKPNRGVNDGDS